MKDILLLLIFCFAFNLSYSQKSDRKHNNVFIEIGGTAIYGSINYERNFYLNDKFGSSLSIGILPINAEHLYGVDFFPIMPMRANAFYEQNKHKYVLGFSVFPVRELTENPEKLEYFINYNHSFFLGYRYTYPNNRFNVGFSLNPIIDSTGILIPWVGFQIGYFIDK